MGSSSRARARSINPTEIVKRLKLNLPVHLDGLIDPLGNEFSVHRENLMALLTTDIDAIAFDSQSISPLYMEMARAQRSCEWGAEQLEVRYARWKAQRAEEFRATREKEGGKRPTVAEVEEFYRTHDDYEEMAMGSRGMRVLADLFADAKSAFLMKARAQEHQFRLMQGHEQSLRFDDQKQRLDDLTELEESAERVVQASGSAQAAAAFVAQTKRK